MAFSTCIRRACRRNYFTIRKLVEQVDCQHSRFTAVAGAVSTVVLVDGDRVDLRECVRLSEWDGKCEVRDIQESWWYWVMFRKKRIR